MDPVVSLPRLQGTFAPVPYALLFFISMVLCAFEAFGQDEPHRAATDKIPPILTHHALNDTVRLGEPIVVAVETSDPSGIRMVRLWYRTEAMSEFRPILMQRGENGFYEARIEPDVELGPIQKVEYYFDATDGANNVAALGAALLPLSLTIDTASKVTMERRQFTWKWVLGALAIGGLACATETGICKSPDPLPDREPSASIINAPTPQP